MTHRRRRDLPLLLAKLLHLYEGVQVELHGRYSVERVAEVHAYERTYSTGQCILVLLVTPLPCLAAIVITDLVPLNAPQDGYAHNGVFWARSFVVAFGIGVSVLEQARRFISGLPLSTSTLFGLSILLGVSSMVYAYLIASRVGFPVPFTILVCVPPFSTVMVVTGIILWGGLLRESRQMRHDVIAYIKIMIVQVSLTVVYPAYNYLFIQLSGIEQTFLALILPIVKVVAKNAISFVFASRLEDFKPEVVIFNVEVFHALFVSCCMQSSTSWTTTIALMGVDFIHAWFGAHDVEVQLRTIETIEAKLRAAQAKADALRNGSTNHSTIITLSLIEKAMYFVHHDEAVRRDPAVRSRGSLFQTPSAVAVFPAVLVGPMAENIDRGDAFAMFRMAKRGWQEPETDRETPGERTSSMRTWSLLEKAPTQHELFRISSLLSHVPEETRSVLNVLTTQERIKFVAGILRVLHIAEFLLLIEFVEVMIPVVYCVYLTAMFHLPNRVYYPQLAQMDSHSLLSTISGTLAYAALEFVSFVGLSLVLRRKLQLSPVHHLAFVVHTQWNLVQSKMVLWVLFAVQTSLKHFGYDYSFRFAWLHPS